MMNVRAGKNRKCREIPIHAGPHEHLKLWINDHRPAWPGAAGSALLLNQRGGRLPDRGAHKHPRPTDAEREAVEPR